MATSSNGYTVIWEESGIRNWVIPGADRTIKMAPGPAGFVLAHFTLWFHENIEELDNGAYDE